MCDASEVAFNACFAAGKNCSPISDKISARPFLLNSFAWFNRSSFASALDAADCVIPSFFAALVRLPISAMATNIFNWVNVIVYSSAKSIKNIKTISWTNLL